MFVALFLLSLPLSVIGRPADYVCVPDRPYEWGGTNQLKEAVGQWQRCSCSLACRQGGLWNDPSSPCYGGTDVCDEMRGTQICGPKQMIGNGGVTKIVNAGQCDASSPSCQWQEIHLSWYCYDCPATYKVIDPSCPPGNNESGRACCIGCRFVDTETLIANKSEISTFGYSCVGKGPCKMNDDGLAILKDTEKFCPNFYNIEGHKTIGYGHDCCAKKDCSSIKAPITEQEGIAILRKDLTVAETCIKNIPGVESMTINQFSSYVDFAYNTGCGAPPYTDKKGKFHPATGFRGLFREQIAAKSWTGICSALPATATTANGKPLEGLRQRRKAEARLCGKGTDTYSGCPAVKSKRSLVDDIVAADADDDDHVDDEELLARHFVASRTVLEPRAPYPYCTKHPWTGGAASCM